MIKNVHYPTLWFSWKSSNMWLNFLFLLLWTCLKMFGLLICAFFSQTTSSGQRGKHPKTLMPRTWLAFFFRRMRKDVWGQVSVTFTNDEDVDRDRMGADGRLVVSSHSQFFVWIYNICLSHLFPRRSWRGEGSPFFQRTQLDVPFGRRASIHPPAEDWGGHQPF